MTLSEVSAFRRDQLWPPASRYTLATTPLCPVPTIDPAWRAPIDALVRMADALHAVQVATGSYEPAPGLLDAGADQLAALGAAVGGELGDSLAARARAVRQRDWKANTELAMACRDVRALVCFGPILTWRTKSTDPMFSATVSVPDLGSQAWITALDGTIPLAVSELAEEFGVPGLAARAFPAFLVTRLVACGGEANHFPKHFAFFLPEDEGIDLRPDLSRTVVFENVYSTQFQVVSGGIAQTAMPDAAPALADPVAKRHLLGWFRAHDVGHFLTVPGAAERPFRSIPDAVRGTLSETFADIVGYLVMTTDVVRDRLLVDAERMTAVFLAEMLRYLRRDVAFFADSAAAALEWETLVRHGAVRVDGVRLEWNVAAVRRVLGELAADIAHGVLGADPGTLDRVITAASLPTPSADEYGRVLRTRCSAVPDTLLFATDGMYE